jgi:hypothetical protein
MIAHIAGCDMHSDKRQANYVKALTESRVLLTALQIYREKNGQLPASLNELAASDPQVAQVDLSVYAYSSNGIAVADGSLWLISTPDPKLAGQLIVGRLPVKVTSARSANKHLQATPR